MPDLSELINENFDNIIPAHLRHPDVDSEIISKLITIELTDHEFDELYGSIDELSREVYHDSLEWYSKIEASDRLKKIRLERFLTSQEISNSIKRADELFPNGFYSEINSIYDNQLEKLGIPNEKSNFLRKMLLFGDISISRIFGQDIDILEPKNFGSYSIIGYPIRKALRYMMTINL
jgi:hypothetical protein